VKEIKCFLFLMLFANTIQAQVFNDAYNIATASADVCGGNGLLLNKNPANITNIDQPQFRLSQVIPYSILALQGNAISTIFRIKRTFFAVEYAQLGKENFKYHLLNLTCGIFIDDRTSIGTKIIYHQHKQYEIEQNPYFTAELGMNQTLSNKLKYGVQAVYQINDSKAFDNESYLKIGISYKIDPKLYTYCSVKMNEYGLLVGSMAIEYKFHKNISTQAGWNTLESAYCTGIQYQIKRSKIEIGSSYHPILGFSYAVGLCYRYGNQFIKQ